MTNFDALKQIYEALGGEEEISGTNLDALKAIAEVAGSGGGGGDFIANVVGDTEPYTLDKTYGEIYEAIDDNLVIIRMTSNDHKDVGIVEQIYPYDDGGVTKYQMSIRWLPAWQFNPGTADSYPEENMD